MMRVCEVCGLEEKIEREGIEQAGTRTLHLCENCRTDRTFPHVDSEE
ncbi:TPA: hypothetical protein QCY19_001765 [Bacillus luti]|nr:hypothetical protein [Bacillus luti]